MEETHVILSEVTFQMIQEMKKENENFSAWAVISDYLKGLGATGVTILSLGCVAVLALAAGLLSWGCVQMSAKKGAETIVVTAPPPPLFGNDPVFGPGPVPVAPSPPASTAATAPPSDADDPAPPYTLHDIDTELEKVNPPEYQWPDQHPTKPKTTPDPIPFPSPFPSH